MNGPAHLGLRRAGAHDAPLVAALHAESWRDAYRGWLSDTFLDRELAANRAALWRRRLVESPEPDRHVEIAELDGVAVGFFCLQGSVDADWGMELDNLHVRPAYRRCGIGRCLLAAAARRVVQNNVRPALHLTVIAQNVAALRFYERLGGATVRPEPWRAPDGRTVPCLMIGWRDASSLLTENPR